MKNHLIILILALCISIGVFISVRQQGIQLLTQSENGNAQSACNTAAISVKYLSASYTGTKKCLSAGQQMYSEDNRFTFFSVPAPFRNGIYLQLENLRTKEDPRFNGIISINAPGTFYIFYRKIPGQTAPEWLTANYSRITPADFVNLPQFILRKNDLGLIGVYDIYAKEFPTISSTNIGPAADPAKTAYSMYIPAFVPYLVSSTPTLSPSPTPSRSPLPSPTTNSSALTARVLAIGFNPGDPSDTIAHKYYPMNGKTPADFEDSVFNGTVAAFKQFSNGEINYNIVKKINISTFPSYTNGYQFTVDSYKECVWGGPSFNPAKCEAQKQAFDMKAWIQTNHICETAAIVNADEIWVMSAPYIMTWESQMIGPSDPFFVNSSPVIVPGCTKHYILMNATYERSEPILHIYGHRIESVMNYMTENWSATDRTKYWENFSAVSRYANPNQPLDRSNCGNAHFPANATQSYEYNNPTVRVFNCPDWKNFPNLTGEQESIGCAAWNCDEILWDEHWMGSIPRRQGEATLTSFTGKQFTFKKNWWYYIMFPENTIAIKNTIK